MAEVQRVSNMGEMTQRFIEFVMMQSQHAALFLGQIPNPQTGETSLNLEAASLFIEQLEMIAEKTQGNLSSEEDKILKNALGNLQLVFNELTGGVLESEPEPEPIAPKIEEPTTRSTIISEADSKKRFTKSYGS